MAEEKKECKCCECREKLLNGLKEFTFKALIVYVGVTLAFLTSAALLKPKHHCPFGGPRPRFERQLPPPPVMHENFGMKMHHGKQFNHPVRMKGQFKQPENEFGQIPPKGLDKTTPTPPIPQNR